MSTSRDERRLDLERSGRSPSGMDNYGGVYYAGQGPSYYPPPSPNRNDFMTYPSHQSWLGPHYHAPAASSTQSFAPHNYDQRYPSPPSQYPPVTHRRPSPSLFVDTQARRPQREERYPSFAPLYGHASSSNYSGDHFSTAYTTGSSGGYPGFPGGPFSPTFPESRFMGGPTSSSFYHPPATYPMSNIPGSALPSEWDGPRSNHGQHYGERSRTFVESSGMGPPSPETPVEPIRIKPKRRRADAEQLKILNEVLERTMFPTTEERNALAKQLGMTPRSVQIWFQNKRQARRNRAVAAATASSPLVSAPYPTTASMNSSISPSATFGPTPNRFEGEVLLTGGAMLPPNMPSSGMDHGRGGVSAVSTRRRSRAVDDGFRRRHGGGGPP